MPLVAPQGIFIPKILAEIPLTITTSPNTEYSDKFDKDGFLLYSYRGNSNDIYHRENEGLRKAMLQNIPLIYLHGIVENKYLAVWPVFIVDNYPKLLKFKVAADDINIVKSDIEHIGLLNDSHSADRRAYITRSVKIRLHQSGFREIVLKAYREQCAFCMIKHTELIDAAHIIPDSSPEGISSVKNGIALCKFHHAAFDANLLGLRPDYVIEVRREILDETDGPMLIHGLQRFNHKKMVLPTNINHYPEQRFLEIRYNEFLQNN